jgi:phytoene/squalene synthetase
MTVEPNENDNDRMFCWEQVLKTNRVFRVSQVFAPRHCAAKLLPLYALFSAVEQICSTISDEDIASSKLNWWRIECLQKESVESLHPVLKELNRTGASHDLSQETIAGLLDVAESRLYARSPPDLESLKEMCVELQRPQVELEIDVSGLSRSALKFEPGILARSGMLQLIRESVRRKGQGGFWWIPLNLMARYGVSREDIVVDPRSRAVASLLTEVLAAGVSWGRESLSQFGGRTADCSKVRHLYAINGLYSRKLKRLAGITPDLFARELGRLRPADLLEAWRSARRLQER